ncbi:MAG TPA: DUF6776 family protein [Gammaproteobacteria bacterium]
MNEKSTRPLIIEAWKLRLLLGLAAVAVLLTGWEAYRFGTAGDHTARDGGIAALRAERSQLRQRVGALEMRNIELERKLVLAEQNRQIDAEAYAVFSQERSGLEDRIRGLQDELEIYRGIMSPEQGKIGLEAQHFDLKSALGTGRYRFSFMLTQSGAKDLVARGMVRLTLEGLQDGKPAQLGLTDLTENGEAGIAYRFRYFQAIKGVLQLPEDFQPERIVIKAIPASAPKLPLEWTFDWPPDAGGGTEEG